MNDESVNIDNIFLDEGSHVDPLLIGTADPALREVRSWMALDWYVRVQMPAWLDLAGLTEHAVRVRSMPRISNSESAIAAMPILTTALDLLSRMIEVSR